MHSINKLNILLFRYLVTALLIVATSKNLAAQEITNTVSLTEEEQTWVEQHPIVKASNNIAYAPYDFISAGQPLGFSIDYLNLISAKIGLEIDYVNYGTWSKSLEMAKNKELDLMHSLSINEERAKYFNFSVSYFDAKIVHYGRVGSQRITSVSDLEDKSIGVVKGHVVEEAYKKNYPHFSYVEFDIATEALRALALNEIDVYTGDVPAISYSIAQNNIQGLDIIGDDFALEKNVIDQRIAVHKDNPILMAIINKGMAAVTDDEFRAISDKWIVGRQVNYDIQLTAEEREWLNKNKTISVAAAQNDIPYEYINSEGNISGITGDYLNEISKRLNIEFVWGQNSNWTDALLKYSAHEIDMISYITPTKERETRFNFTEPYMTVNQAIFTLKGGQVFPSLESLKGYSIALEKDTAILGYLKQDYPEIKVIEAVGRDGLVELILSGNVDAFIGDTTLFNSLFSRLGVENIIATGFSEYSIQNAFGIQPDLPLLYSSVQKAMADISPLERQTILSKTISHNITSEIDYGPLFYVVGLSVFGGIIILLWNRKLIRTRREAEDANEAKSNFLTSMSHDLRTPLNAIIGFSETISRETFGPINNKKYADYIDDIHASGEYLLHLVNDILDLSALEANQRELNYESIDGEQLILECKNIVFKLADDKNIDIAINNSEKLPNVYADRSALKQILMNLISNAIKFTQPNGNITISSNVSENNNIFLISDTGCGISEEDIRIIIKPFTKVQSSPFISQEQGTGLGLSIVKSLVSAHAGDLNIESILGEGTTVTFSLPRQHAIQ